LLPLLTCRRSRVGQQKKSLWMTTYVGLWHVAAMSCRVLVFILVFEQLLGGHELLLPCHALSKRHRQRCWLITKLEDGLMSRL
jgi:hypothetical protein